MSRKKKKKAEAKEEKEDIAVFLCRCGSNIAATIDIEKLRKRYEKKGNSSIISFGFPARS